MAHAVSNWVIIFSLILRGEGWTSGERVRLDPTMQCGQGSNLRVDATGGLSVISCWLSSFLS